MVEAVVAGGGTASYTYDHDNRRVRQVAGGTTTNYLWDEQSSYGDVLLETDTAGAIQTSYVLGGTELVSQKKAGTPSYFLTDGQGSTRNLSDSSGALVSGQQYSYDAFGKLLSGQSSPVSNYLYTGQQFDPLTSLYSLRARYYNPGEGRFLSRDTWPVDYQNPVELNRYGYTANNPINLADPSGYAFDYAKLIKNLTFAVASAAFELGSGFIADGLAELVARNMETAANNLNTYIKGKADVTGSHHTLGMAMGIKNGKQTLLITLSDYYNDDPVQAGKHGKLKEEIKKVYPDAILLGGEGKVRGNDLHAEYYLTEGSKQFDRGTRVVGGVSEPICKTCQKTYKNRFKTGNRRGIIVEAAKEIILFIAGAFS